MSDKEVQRLSDELAIRSLVARIAQAADGGDLDDYIGMFTEEASWDFPLGPRHGRADIRRGAQERRDQKVTGPGSSTRHVITTLAVDVETEEAASADSYWIFYRDTTTAPTIFNMGHYHDTFVKEADAWRLARRQITLG
jgi:3-phenylpropionate/cinnamic acid dioxygenase small subunit